MENNLSEEIFRLLDESKKICTSFPNKSYTMSKKVYNLCKEKRMTLEEGFALISMAFACRAKSEINKMLKYSFIALEIFKELNDKLGQIKSLNLIGIAYFYNSMYEEALKSLLQALDVLDEFKDDFLLCCVLNNIGEVYYESMNHDTALEYYCKALEIITDINSEISTASLLTNIGKVYFTQKRYSDALEYHTQSYNILIKENDMVMLGEVENNIGKIHFVNENYDKAEEYLFSALRRLENIDNKFYTIDVLVNIAKLQLVKDSNKSLYYFEKAIQYAEKTNAKKKLSEVCKMVADYYDRIGDFRVALEYFKRYHSVEQEIMTSIVGNKLEMLKIEIEHIRETHKFEKMKIINNRLESEISFQRSELQKIRKINKVLEKKALEDELTGVPNRTYINYHLNKAWEESMLCDPVVALFIIDIDNFKKYNDYWGHIIGDQCIVKVANCLKDIQVKRKDIFGRYGGEEFIYFAKNLTYDKALELGNKLKSEVEKLCLKYTLDENSSVITISLGGVLGKTSQFDNISDIIQVADKELYKAKNNGRNIVYINNLVNH